MNVWRNYRTSLAARASSMFWMALATSALSYSCCSASYWCPRISRWQQRVSIPTAPRLQTRTHQPFCATSSPPALPDAEMIERQTMMWVRRVVVGLNLCPFAKKPMLENKLSIHVVVDMDRLLPTCLAEMARLSETSGTSLIVCPDCYPDDFEAYLQVLHEIEDLIVSENLTGKVQVAPFHPLFQFEGSMPSDADNYTNRSPFPTFHIIREVEVTAAVDMLDGDASIVWSRNVDLLQTLQSELGDDDFRTVLQGTEKSTSLRTSLLPILRRFRIHLKRNDSSFDDDS